MEPFDPACYKCGKPEHKEYGYFLVRRARSEGHRRDETLTLGNLYTMRLCDACVKRELVRGLAVKMAAACVPLAALSAVSALLPGASAVAAVSGALLMFCAGVFLVFMLRKNALPVSAKEGEYCASRLFNRDRSPIRDGITAWPPSKAGSRFVKPQFSSRKEER